MKISPETKKKIEELMDALYFVRWDRYCTDDCCVSIYGWIDREKDSYKDFINIDYCFNEDDFYYITSSAARDEAIEKIICGTVGKANKCQRVEDYFEVDNAIKL